MGALCGKEGGHIQDVDLEDGPSAKRERSTRMSSHRLEWEEVMSDADVNQMVSAGGRVRSSLNKSSDGFVDRPSSFNGTEARSYERRVSFKAPSAEEEGADVEYVVACESAIKSGLDPSDPDGAKECQDDYCIKQLYPGAEQEQLLLAVFDGHGPHGRKSAMWLARNLPKLVKKALERVRDGGGRSSSAQTQTALGEVFEQAQKQMKTGGVDTTVSGSTCTAMLIADATLHLAWVGDSTAVLASEETEGTVTAQPLTSDHKPDDELEEQRIVAHGGIVKALKAAEDTEVMPARVFAADMFAVGEYSPGIAMSRSLGDALATELGVIAAPECTEHPLRASDRFVVIATDGLWEVYTPQEAVEFVHSYTTRHTDINGLLPGQIGYLGGDEVLPTSQALAEEAQRRWITKYENKPVVVDDCGIVIAYINHESLDVLDSGSLPPERQFSMVDHRDTPHADRLSNLQRSSSSATL